MSFQLPVIRSRVPNALQRETLLRRAGTQKTWTQFAAIGAPALQRTAQVRAALRPGHETIYPRAIARLASASPISTNADVTSGPPTRIRVGVFILFHS